MAESYDDFYRHYEPFVKAFISRRAPVDMVADLVAEVFVIAWRRPDVMPSSALPWLYRTARNVVGDSYRSTDRLRSLEQRLAAVPAEVGADPAAVAAERSLLFASMAALSDQEREILLLAAWEGLDPSGIASVLGIRTGAASVRLHRARRRLERSMRIVEVSGKET